MSDRENVTLYQGDGTPKDIRLYALPVASVVSTVIFLAALAASPNDIILRDATVAPGGGGPPVTGTLTLSAEAFADATAVLGMSGTLTLSAEAYADATGIGGIALVTHPRTIVRSLFPQRAATPTGTLTLALARPPRGARTPSRLIPQ